MYFASYIDTCLCIKYIVCVLFIYLSIEKAHTHANSPFYIENFVVSRGSGDLIK